ncbi:MAG TPA: hypothetical protein VN222_04180, partial [Novosphingobium sp.]|nr:hypothetical protein [Novosphingobium sp.]
ALVRSVAGTSDGRGRRSIFAPSAEGEADAMRRAIADTPSPDGEMAKAMADVLEQIAMGMARETMPN